MKFEGGCLCNAVRYEGYDQQGGGHCHCIDCRKTSGTGHGSHMVVPQDKLKVSGEIKFFDKPSDSGNIVSRSFCPTCGSAIYSKNSGMPGMAFVRASSLDDPNVFQPQMVVYKKRAANWDFIDPTLPSFAGMPSIQDMPVIEA
ncbi:GFA family protein [Acaryochloris marina NIES-2412]|uniref:GFA family protein n=1 Tax=Acaryochloris marina TaxID=155978 RepID=UPI0040599D6F